MVSEATEMACNMCNVFYAFAINLTLYMVTFPMRGFSPVCTFYRIYCIASEVTELTCNIYTIVYESFTHLTLYMVTFATPGLMHWSLELVDVILDI